MANSPFDLFSLSSSLKTLSLAPNPKNARGVGMGLDQLRKTEELAREAVSHTKYLRNISTSLFVRFPPEVVALVVSFLQPVIPDHMPFKIPDNHDEWIHASHVCRHWRKASITTPDLWTTIFLDRNKNPGEVAERLRRSGALPFVLHFNGALPGELFGDSDEKLYDSLLHIFSESRRLRHFHFQTSWVRNSSFWDLLRRSAPLLETLTIEMSDEAGTEVRILPQIFNDDMPRLKNVYMSNVSAWPYNRFRNLVRLHLFDQDWESRPHFVSFLQLLEASSATLEELVMIRAGPDYRDIEEGAPIISATPRVPLPALRYLEISRLNPWRDGFRYFFSHIVIPSTAKCCFHEFYHSVSLSEYFPSAPGEEGHPLFLRKLSLTSFSTRRLSSNIVGRAGSTIYANFESCSPDFLLYESPKDQEFLRGVKELVYSPACSWSARSRSRILANLPSIHTLKLIGVSTAGLRSNLHALQERDSEGTKGPMKYFPLLENLHVYCRHSWSKPDLSSQMDTLIRTLDCRRRGGSPIKTLVVDGFPRDQTDRLQGRFEDVIVLDSSKGDETGMNKEDILSAFWEWYHMYHESSNDA